jgi:glycine oxidase
MARLAGRRIVVAGAGALGLTCALEAARGGAAVTVVDPGEASASAIAAGMLAPVFETAFEDEGAERLALLIAARDRWPPLAAVIGLDLDSSGALAVGEEAQVAGWVDRLAALGIAAPTLPPRAVQARAPGVREDGWGVFVEADWRLEPGAALIALRAALTACGGEIVAGAVEGFDAGQARLAGGDRLVADDLVVATGASTALAAVAPEVAALTPIKGHILTAPQVALAGPVVRYAGGYICPGAGGAVIGALLLMVVVALAAK